MFLQAETAADPRQCFSLVYTKSDGVLNTGSAASPGDKVGLAAILLRRRPPPPPSLAAVCQVVILLLFADGCRLRAPQLPPPFQLSIGVVTSEGPVITVNNWQPVCLEILWVSKVLLTTQDSRQ